MVSDIKNDYSFYEKHAHNLCCRIATKYNQLEKDRQLHSGYSRKKQLQQMLIGFNEETKILNKDVIPELNQHAQMINGDVDQKAESKKIIDAIKMYTCATKILIKEFENKLGITSKRLTVISPLERVQRQSTLNF